MHRGAVSHFFLVQIAPTFVRWLLCLFVLVFLCSWRPSILPIGQHVCRSLCVRRCLHWCACLSVCLSSSFPSLCTRPSIHIQQHGHIFRTIETDMQEGRAFLSLFFAMMVHTTISQSVLVFALVVINGKASLITNNSDQLTNQLPLFVFFFSFCLPLSPFSPACLSARLHVATCYFFLSFLWLTFSLSHSPTSYNLSMYLTRYTIDDSFSISTSSCRLLFFPSPCWTQLPRLLLLALTRIM